MSQNCLTPNDIMVTSWNRMTIFLCEQRGVDLNRRQFCSPPSHAVIPNIKIAIPSANELRSQPRMSTPEPNPNPISSLPQTVLILTYQPHNRDRLPNQTHHSTTTNNPIQHPNPHKPRAIYKPISPPQFRNTFSLQLTEYALHSPNCVETDTDTTAKNRGRAAP